MLDIQITKQQGDFAVDLSVLAPDIGVTALFGRSGAGKTSVINMVAGLVRPDSGHINVNGRMLFDAAEGINLPPEKRRLGYIFQDGRLFSHLSVKSNLLYGMRLTPPSRRHVVMDDVVDLLGIGHLLHRRPAKLSGGEKQRVAIGRALLTSPALLLMDEPLASLDSRRKAEVLPFLSRLCADSSTPILYVSHSLEEVINLADTMVLMDEGRVTASGPIEELIRRGDLQRYTGDEDLGTVISTAVDGHADELTRLRFQGGVMWVPKVAAPKGSRLRVSIAARSIAIALEKPQQTSVQNIYRGKVTAISNGPGDLIDVQMDIGCPLTARITSRARRSLSLVPGKQVYAFVKSVAVSRGHLNASIRTAIDTPRTG
ncbi:MAG: molybdenum ABC transporter ATP-binding protein [Desulfobacteraceae bacterium]